jgi:hypothetical protein
MRRFFDTSLGMKTTRLRARVLLLVKTHTTRFTKHEQTVKELHLYQVPSIVMLPIISGPDDYVNMISQEVNVSATFKSLQNLSVVFHERPG